MIKSTVSYCSKLRPYYSINIKKTQSNSKYEGKQTQTKYTTHHYKHMAVTDKKKHEYIRIHLWLRPVTTVPYRLKINQKIWYKKSHEYNISEVTQNESTTLSRYWGQQTPPNSSTATLGGTKDVARLVTLVILVTTLGLLVNRCHPRADSETSGLKLWPTLLLWLNFGSTESAHLSFQYTGWQKLRFW